MSENLERGNWRSRICKYRRASYEKQELTGFRCCLTTDADKKFDFTQKEKDILKMIMDRAEEMGMGDQK